MCTVSTDKGLNTEHSIMCEEKHETDLKEIFLLIANRPFIKRLNSAWSLKELCEQWLSFSRISNRVGDIAQ